MRRRDVGVPAESVVPVSLTRFVAGEWPGADVWAAFKQWKAARHAFVAEHPGTALGDLVDCLAGERAARIAMAPPAEPVA